MNEMKNVWCDMAWIFTRRIVSVEGMINACSSIVRIKHPLPYGISKPPCASMGVGYIGKKGGVGL